MIATTDATMERYASVLSGSLDFLEGTSGLALDWGDMSLIKAIRMALAARSLTQTLLLWPEEMKKSALAGPRIGLSAAWHSEATRSHSRSTKRISKQRWQLPRDYRSQAIAFK
jgi:hypothetical protein